MGAATRSLLAAIRVRIIVVSTAFTALAGVHLKPKKKKKKKKNKKNRG